jgi:bidirectional [NiFe] hydrogenase diaphorase subunit
VPKLRIDGRTVMAPDGQSVLHAARSAGVRIPTLCDHEGLEPWGGCRLCLVEVTKADWTGDARVVASCMYPVEDGLIVRTASPRMQESRRVVLDLLLARCPDTPLVQQLAHEYGIESTSYAENPEPTDCVLCGLCTRACDAVGASAISSVNRGAGREIAPPFDQPPPDCIGCLACAEICPTGCIPYESSDETRAIWGRTFEMQRCTSCGRAHLTRAQVAREETRHGLPPAYFETCDACKRRLLANTFKALQASR